MKTTEQVLTETVTGDFRFDGQPQTKIWTQLPIWTGDVNIRIWTKQELEKLYAAIKWRDKEAKVKLLVTVNRKDRRILERLVHQERMPFSLVLGDDVEHPVNQLWLRADHAIDWEFAEKHDLMGVEIPWRDGVMCENLAELVTTFSTNEVVRHSYYRPANR